jgi:hypothetical protein
VFSVSPSDASSFQERYQRLIEEWIREFVSSVSQRNEDEHESESELKITETTPDGEEILYGSVGNGKLINRLTPEKISRLENLGKTPAGIVAEDVGAMTVKIGGKVVLESDASGKVVVNSLYKNRAQQQQVPVSPPSPIEPVESSRDSEERSLEVPTPTPIPTQTRVEITDSFPKAQAESSYQFDNFFDGDLPEVPAATATPATAASQLSKENSKSGLEALKQSLDNLPEGPFKQVLQGVVTQMQVERARQQPQEAMFEELLARRVAEPKRVSWWQQVSNQLEMTFSSVQQKFSQYRSATTLKTLFERAGMQDGQIYHASAYTLTRKDCEYTFADTSGKPLMRFRSTPLGVQTDPSLPPLPVEHHEKLQQLRSDLVAGRTPSGAFATVGQEESKYLKRVTTITTALTQYAANQKTAVQIDGQFSYKWKATPDGRVRIDAKDGRGPLLVAVGGQLRCRMGERDLAHFEQMLPVLQGSRTQTQPVTPSRTKSELSIG